MRNEEIKEGGEIKGQEEQAKINNTQTTRLAEPVL